MGPTSVKFDNDCTLNYVSRAVTKKYAIIIRLRQFGLVVQ